MSEMDEIMRKLGQTTPEQREITRQLELEAAEYNRTELSSVVEKVNDEFKIDGIAPITADDIRFRLQIVGDWGMPESQLSKNLFDAFFAKPQLTSYSHYSSLNVLREIVGGKKLRLYSLVKNFGLEFVQFYDDHNMDGYFKRIDTNTGKPYFEMLMSEIFCLCLTSNEEDASANTRWTMFGDKGKGVRLVFKVDALTPDFRKIHYQKRKTTIGSIKNLNEHFLEKYNRYFIFSQTSKFGAFYINNSMSDEREYRFLIKKDTDDYGFCSDIKLDEKLTKERGREIHYIEEEFDNPYGKFRLLGVQPGPYCDPEAIKEILAAHKAFADVKLLPQFPKDVFENIDLE